jgi:hypothetical protein
LWLISRSGVRDLDRARMHLQQSMLMLPSEPRIANLAAQAILVHAQNRGRESRGGAMIRFVSIASIRRGAIVPAELLDEVAGRLRSSRSIVTRALLANGLAGAVVWNHHRNCHTIGR